MRSVTRNMGLIKNTRVGIYGQLTAFKHVLKCHKVTLASMILIFYYKISLMFRFDTVFIFLFHSRIYFQKNLIIEVQVTHKFQS